MKEQKKIGSKEEPEVIEVQPVEEQTQDTETADKLLVKGLFKGVKVVTYAILALVALVALLLFLNREKVAQAYHDIFSTRTEIGHVMLADLAKTDKLTVLSVYKEVIVSQYKIEPGIWYGTNEYQIHSVYPGRIDVGFDLTQCADDWLLMREDTAYVTLPPVEILNQGNWYIDETARQTPIEEGTWNQSDYARLAHRANALIKRNSELENCYRMAEDNGKRVVENLLKALGIRYVKVVVTPRESYKPFTLDVDGSGKNRVHYDFYTDTAKGSDYVKYADGGRLFYKGDISDEDLYSLIDMFSYFTRDKSSRYWTVFKQGNVFTITIMNQGLTKGSSAADAFVRSRRPADVERLSAALKQMLGDALQLTITEVDRRGEKLYQY